MTDTRNKRHDGVRTYADLLLRCVVDEETGCILWRGAVAQAKTRTCSPVTRVWLPEGLDGKSKGVVATASKAAWVLAGRPLKPGQVVWHQHCTRWDCIAPEHHGAGTRREMFAAIAEEGRHKGKPHRAVVNAKNRAKMLVPVERVRQAEELFAEGKLQKEVRAALGLSQDTARRIRLGVHPNSKDRQGLVRGASVFSMGIVR